MNEYDVYIPIKRSTAIARAVNSETQAYVKIARIDGMVSHIIVEIYESSVI